MPIVYQALVMYIAAGFFLAAACGVIVLAVGITHYKLVLQYITRRKGNLQGVGSASSDEVLPYSFGKTPGKERSRTRNATPAARVSDADGLGFIWDQHKGVIVLGVFVIFATYAACGAALALGNVTGTHLVHCPSVMVCLGEFEGNRIIESRTKQASRAGSHLMMLTRQAGQPFQTFIDAASDTAQAFLLATNASLWNGTDLKVLETTLQATERALVASPPWELSSALSTAVVASSSLANTSRTVAQDLTVSISALQPFVDAAVTASSEAASMLTSLHTTLAELHAQLNAAKVRTGWRLWKKSRLLHLLVDILYGVRVRMKQRRSSRVVVG